MPAVNLNSIKNLGSGYKAYQQFLASDTFVVPSGVYSVALRVQGGGGNGGTGLASNNSGGGGAGGNMVHGVLLVQPADTLTLTVGAAGGGDSIVELNGVTYVLAEGGGSGGTPTDGGNAANNPFMTLIGSTVARGGDGGNGSAAGGINGQSPYVPAIGNTTNLGTWTPRSGGTAGIYIGPLGSGGGGGASFYGDGGDGGLGSSSGLSTAGQSPAADAYGAGGGGAGEDNPVLAGGLGIQGVIEMWY